VRLRQGLADLGYNVSDGTEQIIALEAGSEPDTLILRKALERHGIYGAVFCAPATPKNRSLVRLTLNAGLREDECARLLAACAAIRDDGHGALAVDAAPAQAGARVEGQPLAGWLPAMPPSSRDRGASCCAGAAQQFLRQRLRRRIGVGQQGLSRFGDGGIADAGIARIGLARHEADLFQRHQRARDAGRRQRQALGQVDAAQAAARGALQVVQQLVVAETQAMQIAQDAVEAAHQQGLGARQAQAEVQRAGAVRRRGG
jgi:hypothetical protein